MPTSDENTKILEKRLDSIESKLDDVAYTLVKNTQILDEHMRRTTQLEDRVDELSEIRQEIQGAVKLIKLIALLAGIAESVSMVVRHWH